MRQEPPRGLASVVHAEAEEADGASAPAAGDRPALRISPGRAGGRLAQADGAGMGALRCRGGLLSMLWVEQRLGGTEGAAASDACAEPPGLWRAEVEEAVAV